MSRRGVAVHVAVLALLLALGSLPLFTGRARVTRAHDQVGITSTLTRLPSGDFALSGSGRHLRHVSLAEPGAAFADVVAGPDGDPAGGALAPPRAVWTETEAPR